MTNLEKPRIAIIGAGMAGILSGIKLAEAGFDDFTIYEKADRVGGTWRENSYPGLSCDVPSHLYSYSFAPNAEWSRRFSPGPEIQAYFEEMTRRYSLESHIAFDTEVKRCSFEDGRWKIETADGDIEFAHFVIAATGVLHHPSLPDIPGLDRFEGKVFHSARWDHDVSIDDKRVGIIGTGSTAVQIVSALVDRVAKLSVFQRTPQWIMPQENPAYDEEEKAAFRAEPERMRALREDISRLFADNFANAVVDADSPQMKLIEQLCRENLETSVADPELRERLRPDYRAACKRLVISPDFYHAMQQPNVDLVTESISGAEASGLRTRDGALHELDVLVLATGFRVDRFMRPIEVRGRNGVALEDVWRDRPTAYLAIAIPDFPNLFMLNGPNGPVGNFSLIEVAEMQIAYILKLMEWVRGGDCREVSVRKRASEQFDRERTEAARNTVWATGCRSWYLDDRGIPAVWPWTFDRFKQEMSRPDPEHFERV
jgi:cation diffusion facilitator CzcD-associated flavoprotein CzcO